MSTVVSLVVALFFLAMGGYALAMPADLVRPFRLVADTPESRSEIRAVYGGFGIAVAAVLIVAVLRGGELRQGVTLTVACALAGMAIGRVFSRFLDGRTAFYPIWFYCCVEFVAAGMLLLTA
ncbi:DUF4345 domain-containing protein [Amycolatopsis sp. NPDC051071]|uniref:DUF4345 domain-containing protein n=1 Tax=Amycolatopsis sp. NPDC051071 TaxID=3154637 RepID=UPI003421525C